MKKKSSPPSASTRAKKPEAARKLGGQPENDEDARAAGFKSATSGEKKPAKSGR